jgi:hypothetical protein
MCLRLISLKTFTSWLTVSFYGYSNAMVGITTAEGIERLWEVSIPLLEAPPPVGLYPPGEWGPKSIHQLVTPHAW